DFQNFRVKPFQFYFMVPGQVHSWSFEGNMDGYVINFSASFLQTFLMNAQYLERFSFFCGNVSESVLDIPEDFRLPIIELLDRTVAETQSAHRFKLDAIRVSILQLFLMIGNT